MRSMTLATTTTRRGFVDSSPLDGWVTGGRGDATSLMVEEVSARGVGKILFSSMQICDVSFGFSQ